MKNLFLSSRFALVSALMLFSCVKNPDMPFCPSDPPACSGLDSGFVTTCPVDTSLWYINIPASQITLNAMTRQLVLPVNLPANFRKTGLFVTFRYEKLGDSLAFICKCGNAPREYAKKIKLCGIRRSGSAQF